MLTICGCCKNSGWSSGVFPVCTDCANVMRGFPGYYTTISVDEIKKYCVEHGMTMELVERYIKNMPL